MSEEEKQRTLTQCCQGSSRGLETAGVSPYGYATIGVADISFDNPTIAGKDDGVPYNGI
jgi:hypothetical protein